MPLEPCPTCGQPQSAGRFGAVCLPCLLQLADLDEPTEAKERGERELAATGTTVRTFGDYDLLEEIARGGMGVVYRARQRSLDREVALKLVLGAELADKETQRRLQREAHAAASLHHPNIVPVYDIGEVDQQPYFTMRLVPGGLSIADWAARDRRNHRATAAAVAQVARAVAHAHERGVLHRDLKPSNVLWDPEGGPQVTDFGLAKWLDDPMSSLSHSGNILGSPSYMAPEQAAGRQAEVTTASDVYGIGALLYELLSGDPPFRAATSLETLQRAQTQPPERLSRNVPGLDRDLETICLKCLEKNPAHRYASARELAEELERFGRREPILARRVSAPVQLWRWARRNPRLAVSLGGLVVGMLATTWQWRKAELAGQGERQAREEATANVAELLANRGFTSAREGDPSRAALWFAHAAAATSEPHRRSVNGVRWRAWREDAPVAVRAFAAEVRGWSRLSWNPVQTALVVQHRLPVGAAVWEIATESRWEPERNLQLAQWLPQSGRLAILQEGELRILEFPSGRELARQALPPEAAATAHQLVVSPDERWIGLGGKSPLLWEHAAGTLSPLPQTAARLPTSEITPDLTEGVWLEFSRDGRSVLLSGRGWRGACALAAPASFAFPPLDSNLAGPSGFLGDGRAFVIRTTAQRLVTVDTASGAVVGEVPLAAQVDPNEFLLSGTPSPDGRYIARHDAPLIDVASGRNLAFPVHRNIFFDVDFSRDGTLLATASTDDTVRLWRVVPSGTAEQGQLIGWHQEATSVAISPDQRLLATGQVGGGLVRIWRLPEPAARREFPEGPTWLEVSPDHQFLVQSGWCEYSANLRSTRVRRVGTGEFVGPELTPGGILMYAAFAPDANWLALAASTVAERAKYFPTGEPGAGTVTIWNFRTGERLGEPVELPFEPRALAVHPGGHKLGIFGAGRALAELDRSSGQVRILQAPGRFPNDNEAAKAHCLYSPDGSTLVAWGRGLPPLIWNADTGARVESPQLSQANTWCAEFAGPTLAVANRDGKTHLLRVPSGAAEIEPLTDTNWILFCRFDAKGELLLTGGRNRLARVWNWRARRQQGPALAHEDEVYAGCFVPGTPYVITGGRDGSLHFWDARRGQEVRSALRLGGVVEQLEVVTGGQLAVNRPARGGRPPGGILLFDLARLLPEPGLPVGEMLALAELDASIAVRNALPETLNAEDWLRRWQDFRKRYPAWHRW